MSSVRSTAAMASLPQISFCSGLATGASARTVGEMFSLAFMGVPVIRYHLGEADHSSPVVGRAIEWIVAASRVSGDACEQCFRVAGLRISPPSDVVIGAHQHEVARVEIARFFARDIDYRQRQAEHPRGGPDRLRGNARIEPHQGEVAAETIENRNAVFEPHVRRPRTWNGTGRVAVTIVGRSGRAVGYHDGGARIEDAEVNSRNVEFRRGMPVEALAEHGARRFAGRILAFEVHGQIDVADRVGHRASESRVAVRDGFALVLVTREQARSAPSLACSGELPAEIGDVVHRGVVAQAAGRSEKVRSVTGDEGAPRAEAFGDERVARGPFGDAQYLEWKIATGGSDERFAGVIRGRLSPARQLHVEHPEFLSVDRVHEGALLAIHRPVLPGPGRVHHIVERRGSYIHSEHLPAHKVALLERLTLVVHAERFAHETPRPVAADRVVGVDALELSGLELLGFDRDAVRARLELAHAPAQA